MRELFIDFDKDKKRKDRASAPDPISSLNLNNFTTSPDKKQWVLTVKQRSFYFLEGKRCPSTNTMTFKGDLYAMTDLIEKLTLYDDKLQYSLKTEFEEELL